MANPDDSETTPSKPIRIMITAGDCAYRNITKMLSEQSMVIISSSRRAGRSYNFIKDIEFIERKLSPKEARKKRLEQKRLKMPTSHWKYKPVITTILKRSMEVRRPIRIITTYDKAINKRKSFIKSLYL